MAAFRRTEGNTMAQKDRGESESLKKDRGFTVRDRTELKNEHPKCTSSCGLFLTCRKKESKINFHVIIYAHNNDYDNILSLSTTVIVV